MQMSAFAAGVGNAQSANVGNVSGRGNTVNATNSITNVLQKADEKKWSEKLLSLHPSDGRFGQVMRPNLRGHRMVPGRTDASVKFRHRWRC
jgi:hypothetical protein